MFQVKSTGSCFHLARRIKASASDLTHQLCICCGRSRCYHLEDSIEDFDGNFEWKNSCVSLDGTDFTSITSGSNQNFFSGGRRQSPSVPTLYQNGYHMNGKSQLNTPAYTSSSSIHSNNNGDSGGYNNFFLRKKTDTELENDRKGKFQYSNNRFYIGETTTRNAEAVL